MFTDYFEFFSLNILACVPQYRTGNLFIIHTTPKFPFVHVVTCTHPETLCFMEKSK